MPKYRIQKAYIKGDTGNFQRIPSNKVKRIVRNIDQYKSKLAASMGVKTKNINLTFEILSHD